jgi:hypothetical protein
MEEEASTSNEQIANESHQEDSVVTMFQTATDALCSEVHEQQIGESVDDLRRVLRHDIILQLLAFIPRKILR